MKKKTKVIFYVPCSKKKAREYLLILHGILHALLEKK